MAADVFDSSAVVKRYVRETGMAWVLSVLDPGAGHALYVARITGVEVVSALTRQARSGALVPTAVVVHTERQVLGMPPLTLVSADAAFNAAAAAEGLLVEDPNTHP